MSTSDIVGTTQALHLSEGVVKIIHSISSKSGVYNIALDAAGPVAHFLKPRAFCEVTGPIIAQLLAPADAGIVISAAATIIPTNPTKLPTDLTGVRADVSTQNFAVSALTPVPTATLSFHPAINTVLKPRPLSGRHPQLLIGWHIETKQTSFKVDLDVTIRIKFSGADWEEPSTW
uniref:HP4 n=1 Tax=Agave tequilana deltaflexivirus 1 TaxID=2794415 RepID=A0A7T5QZD5_9VIRU|nr:HP4 [Agave tequilana deltaflexivirus 1]